MDDLAPLHRVIRTLVIDDHPIFRAGIIDRLLAKNDEIEIEIVSEGSNGFEAIKLAKKHHPHVILMDI